MYDQMQILNSLLEYVEKYADPDTVHKCKEFYNAFVEWNLVRAAHQETINKLGEELVAQFTQLDELILDQPRILNEVVRNMI